MSNKNAICKKNKDGTTSVIHIKPMKPSGETVYSITINPQMQYGEHKYKASRAEMMINHMYNRFLRPMKTCTHFTMYPEISDGGRWHLHGVFKLTDSFVFYDSAIFQMKRDAMIEIDTIDDPKLWAEYITKSEDVMRPALSRLGLPYMLDNEITKPKSLKDF